MSLLRFKTLTGFCLAQRPSSQPFPSEPLSRPAPALQHLSLFLSLALLARWARPPPFFKCQDQSLARKAPWSWSSSPFFTPRPLPPGPCRCPKSRACVCVCGGGGPAAFPRTPATSPPETRLPSAVSGGRSPRPPQAPSVAGCRINVHSINPAPRSRWLPRPVLDAWCPVLLWD